MLRPQAHHPNSHVQILFPLNRPLGNGASALLPIHSWRPQNKYLRVQKKHGGLGFSSTKIKAHAVGGTEKPNTDVKAFVTVKSTVGGFFSNLGIDRGLDNIKDLAGKTLLLEFVSSELDPKTGLEKETIKSYAQKVLEGEKEVKYEANLVVSPGFGEIGAVIIENGHHKEIYLKDIVFDGLPDGRGHITCNSWVHSKFDNPTHRRVFFTNKSYLPLETPSGLTKLREEELVILRGDGTGERKTFERIYDYDMYNDLGIPDIDVELARPVLGGKTHPYPRRCRTGRPHSEKDPLSEKRSTNIYVPRDEAFGEVKELTFATNTFLDVLHALVPSIETALIDANLGFPDFPAIDELFRKGINLPSLKNKPSLSTLLPTIFKTLADASEYVLRFEPPDAMERDKFFWLRDEEFARETLAGVNPYSIKLITEWPLVSKLDPSIYGPSESAITKDIIEQEIKAFMTLEEAINQKKLFMLDYHDLLLPFVKRVRGVKGTTLYGSRTIFFLDPDNRLRPVAIELTRPPYDGMPQWKQVYRPSGDSTVFWLWRLAQAHVRAHHTGHHEVVTHWLRTHCATEPYVIATNRQLSAMHPIYRLLHPHFRYTMEINALGREVLINADGIIEISFSLAKYSMEYSSIAYDQQWQFDLQALPADLINRGMATKDPSASHGLKLTIEDYPFASDGLILWDNINQWVTEYVNHYYLDPDSIITDRELQSWWTEIQTVGHGDKKDEPWWPKLNTQSDLIQIITTIVWVASGHHAATNFGQYAYGGYFPNSPTIARINMPTEDPVDEKLWKKFMEKPENVLLQTYPSQIQATLVMAILALLSTHSPDEQYIGDKIEAAWAENPIIKVAFEQFKGRLKEMETIIDERNANKELKNRSGAGIVPYELLKPFSKPGLTGMGVPCSISI